MKKVFDALHPRDELGRVPESQNFLLLIELEEDSQEEHVLFGEREELVVAEDLEIGVVDEDFLHGVFVPPEKQLQLVKLLRPEDLLGTELVFFLPNDQLFEENQTELSVVEDEHHYLLEMLVCDLGTLRDGQLDFLLYFLVAVLNALVRFLYDAEEHLLLGKHHFLVDLELLEQLLVLDAELDVFEELPEKRNGQKVFFPESLQVPHDLHYLVFFLLLLLFLLPVLYFLLRDRVLSLYFLPLLEEDLLHLQDVLVFVRENALTPQLVQVLLVLLNLVVDESLIPLFFRLQEFARLPFLFRVHYF